MSGWKSTHLDEIPKRSNGWIPVRDHLGVEAFGVNAWTKRESDGELIDRHDERMTEHEELYFVVRGHAKFTLGEDEIDAPEGTIVFVRDPALSRAATPLTDDTLVLTAGGKPGEPFHVSDWELGWQFNQRAFPLYREGKYAEAAAIMREGHEAHPRSSGILYNLACFESLAGEKDAALGHLRQALELQPGFLESAKQDTDFDPIRDDPRFPS